MKKTLKKFVAAFLAAAFAASLAVPMSATAVSGTLGTEKPFLYCEFIDQNGDAADGNTLTAGDYQVNIVLSGMENLSVMQFTADYATENSPVSLGAVSTDCLDAVETLSVGGVKNENGTLVAAYASTEEAATSVDSDGTVLATMEVSVSSTEPVDFQDYFLFNTDPDLTFAEADYGDGIEDAYVLDTTVSTAYNTYLMTADESPENELEPDLISVSGRVVWATAIDGTAEGAIGTDVFGARGVKFQIKDSNDVWTDVTDENGNIVETASDSIENYGNFTVNIPVSTTEIRVVAYDRNTIDETTGLPVEVGLARIVTLSGTKDIEDAYIPYLICDYNGSETMNITDTNLFNAQYNSKSIFADINDSNTWNITDKNLYNAFKNKKSSYKTSLNLDD